MCLCEQHYHQKNVPLFMSCIAYLYRAVSQGCAVVDLCLPTSICSSFCIAVPVKGSICVNLPLYMHMPSHMCGTSGKYWIIKFSVRTSHMIQNSRVVENNSERKILARLNFLIIWVQYFLIFIGVNLEN